jgi:hypothetical protein
MYGCRIFTNREVIGSNDRIKGFDEATPLGKASSTKTDRTTPVKVW